MWPDDPNWQMTLLFLLALALLGFAMKLVALLLPGRSRNSSPSFLAISIPRGFVRAAVADGDPSG